MKFIERIGSRYGLITITGRAESGNKNIAWAYLCDCGRAGVTTSSNLKRGQSSCGCGRKGINSTHGESKSRTYRIWKGLRNRCCNPNVPSYKSYGGRGITVCDRWDGSYELFLADMGECPDGYSIERVDVNRGYQPNNCIWIPLRDQARNRRNTRKIEDELVVDAAKRLGISYSTVLNRIKKGIPINRPLRRKPYEFFATCQPDESRVRH